MHTSQLILSAAICVGTSLAAPAPRIPLTFEQREPAVFHARTGGGPLRVEPGRFVIGDVTLRFLHTSATRLEALGPAAPATYVGASTRTFRQYSRIAIRDLYPGIDAILYGDGDRLEYDLNLSPGASADSVRLSVGNARRIRLAADGALVIRTESGELRQLPPRVLQDGRPVNCRYILRGRNQVGFQLGKHDKNRALTIDPVLVYSKYFGGKGSDMATAVATDGQGNVYVAGQSNSLDFPSAPGSTSGPTPPLLALTNGGKTVTPLPIAGETSVSTIGGTPDGAILYAAASGTIYYSSNGGNTWQKTGPIPAPIFSAVQQPLTVYDISVDRFDPSRAYAATNRGLYSTSNNGGGWFPRDYNLSATDDGSINVSQVTVSSFDHTVLYAVTGTPNYLYKSVDAGNRWQQLTPLYPGETPPGPFNISQIVYAIASNGVDLYVINGNGTLLKSIDAGATWQKLADRLFGARSIQLDPSNAANMYVLDNLGVQKSNDGGQTFTTVLGPGPFNVPVAAFVFEPVTGALYASISSGAYASTDQGATWQGLPVTVGYNIHSIKAIGGRAFIALDTPQTSFLVKFDPTGSRLLYSTFFSGKPLDGIVALQVDSGGNAYLAGTSFNQTPGGGTNLTPPSPTGLGSSVVAKVMPDGTGLAYVDVLGASRGVFLQGLAIDSSGAAYIVGSTASTDFQTTPNAAQPKPPSATCTRPPEQGYLFNTPNLGVWAIAAKIAPDGNSLVYSTFIGGSCGSRANGIAINAAGEAFIGGSTTSYDMPFPANAYQPAFPGPVDKTVYPNPFTVGFAARLSAAGDKVVAGTYIGGGFQTAVNSVAIDSSGNPVFAGSTWGIATGATPGAYQTKVVYSCGEPISIGPSVPPSNGADGFLLKLDPALTGAKYLTYLGGACFESAYAVALDASGNIWVTGITNSTDFPINTPFQGRGITSGFISELSPDASKLLFSSFSDGNTLAIDPNGFVYVAGYTYSPAGGGALDQTAFLGKIDPVPTTTVVLNSVVNVSIAGANSSNTSVAPGQLVRIEGFKLGPAAKVDAQLDSDSRLPFTLAGTRVLFDGIAAPLISVQENAVVCFVPFAVSQTTYVMVDSGGQTSNVVRLNVAPSSPQVLAIANADGSPNSASNPAAQGSVITVYVSGLGQTSPASVDGKLNAAPLPVPLAPVNVFIGGKQVTPQFVAAAAGMIAGITQVNVVVPMADFFSATTFVGVNSGFATLYVAR